MVAVVVRGDPRAVLDAGAVNRQVLQALPAGVRPSRVVLLDGGGSREAREAAERAWGGKIVTGYTVALVQQAIAESPAEIVHVLQADTLVSPLWWQAVPGALDRWPIAAATGPGLQGGQRVNAPESVRGWPALCEAMAGQHATAAARTDAVTPEAWAVRRGPFLDLGGLDVGRHLDLHWALRDLCVRIRAAGTAAIALQGCPAQVLTPRVHPWQGGSTAARVAYYAKHAPTEPPRVAGLLVCQPQGGRHAQLLERTVRSLGGLLADGRAAVDRVHLVVTEHPGRWGFQGAIDQALDALCAWLAKQVAPHVQVGVQLVASFPSVGALEAAATTRVRELGYGWALRLVEGEELEPDLTRLEIDRLCSHPDPVVVAWNVGVGRTWGAPNLLREDPPFGDGGDLTGLQAGSNDWRLYRTTGPRVAQGEGRVSRLRVLDRSLEDPATAPAGTPMEGARVTRARPGETLQVCMLAHEGEPSENVARWLDWTYGLGSQRMVGWTAGVPSRLVLDLVGSLGAHLRPAGRPDGETDFAAWRNATQGGDLETPPPGWTWWIDPDEWVDNPLELVAVRRMTESWRRAFLWEFLNHREGASVNPSSSVRMFRRELGLRWVGYVHETVDGLAEVVAAHGPEAVGVSPLRVHNLATAEPGAGVAKIERYRALVLREIADRPQRAQPWVLLGHAYAADGWHAEALECYRRAVALGSPTAYLPLYEAGMLHLRIGRDQVAEALRRLPPRHVHREGAELVVRSLQVLPELPQTPEAVAPPPLPEWVPPMDLEDEEGAEVRGG
jgi:hypothetical protein